MAYANWIGIALDRTTCFADISEFVKGICFSTSGLTFPLYAGGGIIASFFGTMPEDNDMETYQGLRLTDRWYSVRLVDFSTRSVPRTNITFGSVVVGYGFESAVAETNMPVLITDWAEQGGGDYWLQMGLTEFASYGKYMIRVSPVSSGNFADRSFVVEIPNPVENIFGTAQGGTPNSIQLGIGESAQDHIYNQDIIYISRGLGSGQKRVIMDYAGGTKIAVVDRTWDINPNNTSEYIILPRADELISNQGIAQAGAASNIQLAVTASAVNDYYVGETVAIVSGLGAGQARVITGYVGGTTTATVVPDWETAPNNTSVYKLIPLGSPDVNSILDADLALHPGTLVGGRNIGRILPQLSQSEFSDRSLTKAIAAVPAQGITAGMAAGGCIQYETVNVSLTRNFAVPDFTYYLLWRYDANGDVVEVKPSLVIV